MKILLAILSLSAGTTAYAQTSRYSNLPQQRVTNTYVSPNYDAIAQQGQALQAEYNRKVASCISQTRDYYEAQATHPIVTTGWHEAIVLSEGANTCFENRMYVDEAGKVTNIQQADGSYGPEITTGTKVMAGKAMYTRKDSETGLTVYYTVYFK